MATGTISGNTIHVTGFTTDTAFTVNNEEIYRVVASGTSTAEASAGAPVISNTAVIKHQKFARIKLPNSKSTSASNLCADIEITLDNIIESTLVVMQYPPFVSEYSIVKSGGTYYIHYCTYVNYGGSQSGKFVVGGLDIYGNIITSNDCNITNGGGANPGSISLTCPQGNPAASVKWNETEYDVLCSATTEIVFETILLYDKSDNLISVEPTGSSSSYHLTFPRNVSQSESNTYHILARGKNIYGDYVLSNKFTLIQEAKTGSSKFFVTGDDIPYSATTGTFGIHYPESIDPSTIGVYEWSTNTITSIPVIGGGSETLPMTVQTEINNSPRPKELIVTVSASTEDNRTIYATGAIIQAPGCHLLIYGVSAYTAPDIFYYVQNASFDYTSMGVTGITAFGDSAFSNAGGSIILNTTTKHVSLSFSKNQTANSSDRTFVITLKGRNSVGEEVVATYTVKQLSQNGNDFTLTQGNVGFNPHIEGAVSGTVKYDTESFTLKITAPASYETFGVSVKDSTSNQYRVWRATITNDELECLIYKNLGSFDTIYTLQVSAATPDRQVRYTNNFIAVHQTMNSGAWIKFEPSTSGNCDADDTESDYITFNYSGIVNAYIESVETSDGSVVNDVDFSFANKQFKLAMQPYPAQTRTITVHLAGFDEIGNPVSTRDEGSSGPYVLTQAAGNAPGIYIRKDGQLIGSSNPSFTPIPLEIPAEPGDFTYEVTYVGVTSGNPVFNSGIFSNVTNTRSHMLLTNESIITNQYAITFTGTGLTSGQSMRAVLLINQKGRDISPEIHIESAEALLKEGMTDYYVISALGGTYPLYVTYQDIDYSTLEAYTDTDNSTGYPFTQKIKFDSIVPESGGSGSEHPVLVGRLVDENTLEIPVGNGSQRYFAGGDPANHRQCITIVKDNPDILVGDTYVYDAAIIDPDSGETYTQETHVYVTARPADGSATLVSSNTITFLQSGTTEPDWDGGGGSGVYNTYFWGSITTVPACAARPYDPDAGVGRAILVGPTGATVTMNVNVNPEYSNYLVKWGGVNQGAGIGHGNPDLGSTTATLRATRKYGSHFMLSLVPPDDPVEASAIWSENIMLIYDEDACSGGGGEDPGTDADYSMSITTGAYNSGGSYCPGLKGFYADSRLTTGTKEDLEINPASWGVVKKTFNQSVPDPVSFVVSDSVDNNCEFWICRNRYNSVLEIHNTGSSTLNIHGYGFKNMVVNDSDYYALQVIVSATTMSGKNVSATISLPAQERSYISDGESEPYVCPQIGGVVEHTFWYDNIDEDTFGFIDKANEISNIEIIELGTRYSDAAGGGTYYRGKLRVTLTENLVGMSEGYDGSHYKYFTITGTSTLDDTQKSCRCSITQESYSYARFPYTSTSELDTYNQNTSHGLLVIPLNGLNLDASRFSYSFCDHLSTKASPIYIDGDTTIETVVKDDGTSHNNTITFNEAIPISLEYGSININGNQVNGYYLTIENQAWRVYDTHGGKLIELTFYDNAGNSWKDGLCIEKSWNDDSVTGIIYRGYSHGWYG